MAFFAGYVARSAENLRDFLHDERLCMRNFIMLMLHDWFGYLYRFFSFMYDFLSQEALHGGKKR